MFGPVATIITVADADEAIAVANDTPFGLGASVWSRDVDAAIAVGKRVTSGACFVNSLVASDARMPFGGTKRCGYGRELAGRRYPRVRQRPHLVGHERTRKQTHPLLNNQPTQEPYQTQGDSS